MPRNLHLSPRAGGRSLDRAHATALDAQALAHAQRRHRSAAREGVGQDGSHRHRCRRRRTGGVAQTPHLRMRSAARCSSSKTPGSSSTSTRPKQLGEVLFDRLGLRSAEEDQDRLFHRRPRAREAAGRASDHRASARLPRSREAAFDLRRGPARRGRRRRPHPGHVQPDRGPHWSALIRRAQSPQHSRAQ